MLNIVIDNKWEYNKDGTPQRPIVIIRISQRDDRGDALVAIIRVTQPDHIQQLRDDLDKAALHIFQNKGE